MFNIKINRLVSCLFMLFFLSTAVAKSYKPNFSADNILGFWYNESKSSIISVYKDSEDRFFGKIVWLEEPNYEDGTPKVDKNNPKEELRSNKIIQLKILDGFHYAKGNVWQGGTIYDPLSGKTYSCVIKMKKEGELNVRGYVGVSLFGRTTHWYKVDPDKAKELIK